MAPELARAFVLSFLLSHGYGDRAGAVMQYIEAESGFQHCVEKRTGHFLFQWVATRVTALHRFAGPGCPSAEMQMKFFDYEMRSGRYEVFWKADPKKAYAVLRRTFGQGGLR